MAALWLSSIGKTHCLCCQEELGGELTVFNLPKPCAGDALAHIKQTRRVRQALPTDGKRTYDFSTGTIILQQQPYLSRMCRKCAPPTAAAHGHGQPKPSPPWQMALLRADVDLTEDTPEEQPRQRTSTGPPSRPARTDTRPVAIEEEARDANMSELERCRAELECCRAELERCRAEAGRKAMEEKATAEQLLMLRLLALREYLELRRRLAVTKAQAKTTWNLSLPRQAVVPSVLEQFGKLSAGSSGGSGPVQLWRSTNVTFTDGHGVPEQGVDEGGLTRDMHCLFWSEVFKPEHGLFEQRGGGRYLPSADASIDGLENAGRMLLKSIIDDHPTGRQLGRFLFEFLSNSHERRVFVPDRPLEALRALADFDEELAEQWQSLVLQKSDAELSESALTLDLFDESLGEGPVTRTNVAEAVVAGCRRILLLERREQLDAFRTGFTFRDNIDLQLQLALIPCEQLMLLVRGKDELSANDLLLCFDLDHPPNPTVAGYLREVIATRLTPEQRWELLRWCTSRSALPANGLELQDRVTLLHMETPSGASADQRLPVAHTCSSEVELPAYGSPDALQRQLERALEEMSSGGGFHEK